MNEQPATVREIRREQAKQSHYQRLGPNSEPQRQFLSTPADIACYGGAAGGGKTFALLLEACRHLNNRKFGGVFFRRTRPELMLKGGAWENGEKIFYGLGGIPNMQELKWYFRTGSTFQFTHAANEKELREKWGSSQIPLILIDQVETWAEKMFWLAVSRNRDASGVGFRPYIRMGCNPEDNWLLKLFGWWIDGDGYAIPERSGVLRWAARLGNELHWGDSREEMVIRFARPGRRVDPISFTFVPAKLADNVDMETADPDYRSKMELLPYDEQMRLLGDEKKGGNWKVKVGAGMFPETAWRIIEHFSGPAAYVRYWDTAASALPDGEDAATTTRAATVGVLLGIDHDGPIVLDVVEGWVEQAERDALVRNTAKLDRSEYGHVEYWIEQEPGGSGKDMAAHNERVLEGFEVYTERAVKDKVLRARPWASAVQNGRVRILNRPWTRRYIDQHKAFPFAKQKDKVDASAGAYNKVADKTPQTDTGILHHDIPNVVDQFAPGTFG